MPEALKQLAQIIADVNRGERVVLTNGAEQVTLVPGSVVDGEDEIANLEMELLRAAKGPFTPYSPEEADEMLERMARERRVAK